MYTKIHAAGCSQPYKNKINQHRIYTNLTNLKKFRFAVLLEESSVNFRLFFLSSSDILAVFAFLRKVKFIVNVNNLIALPESKVYFYRIIQYSGKNFVSMPFRQSNICQNSAFFDPFKHLSDQIAPNEFNAASLCIWIRTMYVYIFESFKKTRSKERMKNNIYRTNEKNIFRNWLDFVFELRLYVL